MFLVGGKAARVLAAVGLCTWLAACATSPPDAGPQSSEAIEHWPLPKVLKLARAGSLVAIHHACYSYSYGLNGAPDDEEQALAWCTKGHESGVPPSTTLLAEIFYSGSAHLRDLPRARALYHQAAADGHPFAMYMTGYLMIEAHDDLDEAMAWLKLAAEEGIPQSRELLDQLEETSRGMPREPGGA